ncbi:hypothetical protein H5410_048749 [Solanum commersonii]|uniref:Uncharacterized protein n=1 Tax=Solanum commersonii TaxID=4109 RepID=A0A9J5XJ31_SOLCO|nr:hypothetical protein H5410_048749 [Solanum commersonii]
MQTDVERALRRVENYMAATNQIEDGHVHEPQVKKRKKSVKCIAILETMTTEGLLMETLQQHQLINWKNKRLHLLPCFEV